MHALIVFSHPEPTSLSAAVANAIGDAANNYGHTAEVADLSAESFDPRYVLADRLVHHKLAAVPDDVAREQARIERANALVLVFPVFWWSMPALLKGWIDRVFSNGWAFEDGPGGANLVKKLGHLNVHLVAIAGSDSRSYIRHGYAQAMQKQIEHGIFDYCGAPVVQSRLLTESETGNASIIVEAARKIGAELFEAAKIE
jgi:NAD(P)H dehydrogenase (quinone)